MSLYCVDVRCIVITSMNSVDNYELKEEVDFDVHPCLQVIQFHDCVDIFYDYYVLMIFLKFIGLMKVVSK